MCCCCCLMQGKDKAADIIKATMPSVALKTTFMWIGFFSSNFHSNPMMKPIEVVSSSPQGEEDKYIRSKSHLTKTDFPRTLNSPTPKTHTSTCNPPPRPSPSTSPAPSPTTPASSCTPSSPTPPSPCPPSTPSSTPRGAPCKSTCKPG